MTQSRDRFGVHKEESCSIKCRSFSTIARGGATIPSAADKHERMDNDNSDAKREIAYIAVGSNLGDRFGNIQNAMELLESYHLGALVDGQQQQQQQRRRPLIEIRHTSHLHQTAAMYVTDQPAFLNGVIAIETTLSPQELLVALKEVEQAIGRDLKNGIRNGPRLIDMDILFYGVVSPPGKKHAEENYDDGNRSGSNHEDLPRSGGCILQTPDLEIPHPRLEEREFVLLPLCELDQTVVHPIHNVTLGELFKRWNTRERQNHATTSTSEITVPPPPPPPRAVRVLPLPRNRMLFLNETLVMGILNVTPDSFSDGGRLGGSVERATQEALQMVADGASIIDIGGESTRPGAKEIQLNEEIKRTIPVIQNIRQGTVLTSTQ
jgi:2-amino-4-hydroxy-6-hydroxymethyldihydropteridine diphosphokinase